MNRTPPFFVGLPNKFTQIRFWPLISSLALLVPILASVSWHFVGLPHESYPIWAREANRLRMPTAIWLPFRGAGVSCSSPKIRPNFRVCRTNCPNSQQSFCFPVFGTLCGNPLRTGAGCFEGTLHLEAAFSGKQLEDHHLRGAILTYSYSPLSGFSPRC